MARNFVWLLLLLNALYWSWAQGWLLPYGFGPLTQREPQRLAQQILPQAITVVSEAEARLKPVAGPTENALCLQTGLLDEKQVALLRAYLATSWPVDSWVFEAAPGLRLRLPAVKAALQAQLPELKAVLPSVALEPCAGPEAPR
jgi:phage tail protein X